MTGVICPSIFEYRFLRSVKLDSKKAVLVLSGMGKVRALHACHELVRKHPGVKRILLVGYAGGLAGLSVGDRIEPDTFIEQDYDARPFELFPNSIRLSTKLLLKGSKRATLLTQDRFLKENPFKGTTFARKHPRMACDMEAYAVAFFCRQRRLPFAAIKFISDAADGTADHDFLKACRRLAPALRKAVKQAIQKGAR